ncbi:Crp/Fnr family transcriptional regulator [Sphingobacteriales bacterium UPWRP_1]|nr:Crp/Fnr family transcriptional regulator [Sphingobacteriales bacterium TSM_CSM]PSJ77787.1 Crp/Fnr family transcriptional regulator [Sphingobacteriales bacterium UPWRP_1]
MTDIPKLLLQDKLRKNYPDFDLPLIDFIAQHAVVKTLPAGQQLIRPGQYFRSVILLTSGKIKVYRQDEEGNEFFMYFIEPGTACALSMVCAARNLSSEIAAITTENTEIALIPIAYMDELVRSHKSWYYFVLETYRKRFEEMLQIIDNVAFKAMDERLEFYLQRLLKSTRSFTLNITHEEIAADLNSSRVVVSRLLKKMEQDGKLQLFRNHIEMSMKHYAL